jgi:hypothetical protein
MFTWCYVELREIEPLTLLCHGQAPTRGNVVTPPVAIADGAWRDVSAHPRP